MTKKGIDKLVPSIYFVTQKQPLAHMTLCAMVNTINGCDVFACTLLHPELHNTYYLLIYNLDK